MRDTIWNVLFVIIVILCIGLVIGLLILSYIVGGIGLFIISMAAFCAGLFMGR